MKSLLLLSYILFLTGFVYTAVHNEVIKCIEPKMETSLQEDGFQKCMESNIGTEIAKLKACMLKAFKVRGVVTHGNKLELQAFKAYGEAAKNTPVGLAAHQCYQENHLHYSQGMEPAPVTQCVFNKLKRTCQ